MIVNKNSFGLGSRDCFHIAQPVNNNSGSKPTKKIVMDASQTIQILIKGMEGRSIPVVVACQLVLNIILMCFFISKCSFTFDPRNYFTIYSFLHKI